MKAEEIRGVARAGDESCGCPGHRGPRTDRGGGQVNILNEKL
jgi:hypothetical protein